MSDRLQAAYAATDFEMVETGAGMEVPTSTPAVFEYSDDVEVVSAAGAEQAIERGDYAMIAPCTENGDGDMFYLSSKILATATNEFLHVKMNSTGVRVFPKGEEFSFETLQQFVEHLEAELGVSLVHVPAES